MLMLCPGLTVTNHRAALQIRSPKSVKVLKRHNRAICRSLLGCRGLHTPVDVEKLAEDCCRQLHAACTAPPPHFPTTAAAAHQHLVALTYVFDFIQACHPDSKWQTAAQAALLQLNSTAIYLHVTTTNDKDSCLASSNAGDTTAAAINAVAAPPAEPFHAQLQELLHMAAQQGAWSSELRSLQAAIAAAAAATQFDPAVSPALQIDAAAAQLHPIWSQDFAACVASSSNSSCTQHTGDVGQQVPTGSSSSSSSSDSPAEAAAERQQQQQQQLKQQVLLPVELPTVSVLPVGSGASLDIEGHYAAAAAAEVAIVPAAVSAEAAPLQSITSSSKQHQSSSTSGSGGPSAAVSVAQNAVGPVVLPWHLTAPNTQLLLCSPLGLLPEAVLGQVYHLGLLARCLVLCDAVDLSRLVGGELHRTQAEQQQLGQQLIQQMEQLHRAAVAGGRPGDPVALAAAAQAAAAMGCGPPIAVAAGNSSCHQQQQQQQLRVHPAVTAAFLRELAAFGKSAAAAELQSALDLCKADPPLRSYLEASGGLQQLPQHVSDLQPALVDALRETVAVAQANSSPTANVVGGVDEGWLQDYTDTPTLLPGVCSVLGSCLSLELSCSIAEPGSTWCKEAYCITVQDRHKGQKQYSQKRAQNQQQIEQSSKSQGHSLCGTLWLLFDDTYQGMPATHMVSPGAPLAAAAGDGATVAAAAAGPASNAASTEQQQHGHPALQLPTVAIIFPASFCSANRGFGSSNSSRDASGSSGSGSSNATGSSRGNGSSGSSALSVLQTLLHELGHALHFLLSASSADDPAAAGGQHCSLEVMETASHLLERMARNATCLKAMLRHRVTLQPPPPALLQQLLLYNSISSGGAYQWHQHVLAALTDTELAAAQALAAAQQRQEAGTSSSAKCIEVLQAVTDKYSPLMQPQQLGLQHQQLQQQQQVQWYAPVVSSAMLEHLPLMVVLQPGDLYCYICAELVSAALWERYLQQDPLNPEAWRVLRQGLFEAGGQHSTVAVFEKMLGAGSMQELSVQLGQREQQQEQVGSVRTVAGWVPDLAHPCFQDIDLW